MCVFLFVFFFLLNFLSPILTDAERDTHGYWFGSLSAAADFLRSQVAILLGLSPLQSSSFACLLVFFFVFFFGLFVCLCVCCFGLFVCLLFWFVCFCLLFVCCLFVCLFVCCFVFVCRFIYCFFFSLVV